MPFGVNENLKKLLFSFNLDWKSFYSPRTFQVYCSSHCDVLSRFQLLTKFEFSSNKKHHCGIYPNFGESPSKRISFKRCKYPCSQHDLYEFRNTFLCPPVRFFYFIYSFLYRPKNMSFNIIYESYNLENRTKRSTFVTFFFI